MKAKRISNPFRKGNQAARKMQVRFFLSLMVLLALVFILDMVMSPGSVLGIYGFSGTTLAAMMVIVNPEKPDVPLNKNDAFQKVQKRRVQEKR